MRMSDWRSDVCSSDLFGIRDLQKRGSWMLQARRHPRIPNPQSPIPARGACAVIGRLKGILIHKQPPWLVVDVHGVGYELEALMRTFYDLPAVGGEGSLFHPHAPKEDSEIGRASGRDRECKEGEM